VGDRAVTGAALPAHERWAMVFQSYGLIPTSAWRQHRLRCGAAVPSSPAATAPGQPVIAQPAPAPAEDSLARRERPFSRRIATVAEQTRVTPLLDRTAEELSRRPEATGGAGSGDRPPALVFFDG